MKKMKSTKYTSVNPCVTAAQSRLSDKQKPILELPKTAQ